MQNTWCNLKSRPFCFKMPTINIKLLWKCYRFYCFFMINLNNSNNNYCVWPIIAIIFLANFNPKRVYSGLFLIKWINGCISMSIFLVRIVILIIRIFFLTFTNSSRILLWSHYHIHHPVHSTCKDRGRGRYSTIKPQKGAWQSKKNRPK